MAKYVGEAPAGALCWICMKSTVEGSEVFLDPDSGAVIHVGCNASPQCAGTTKKGRRCRIEADPDSDLCHVHRPDGKFRRNLRKPANAQN